MARPSVTIRMYKGLLGDCFLIMAKRGARQENILIDCGVLQNVPNERDLVRRAAEDIVRATGGDDDTPGTIHLLVVTHEHWDHISGFGHAADIFLDPARLKIERMWLAWTEKPDDPQAGALRLRFRQTRQALRATMTRLHLLHPDRYPSPDGGEPAAAAKQGEPLDRMGGLGDFLGPITEFAVGERMNGRKILDDLTAAVGVANIDYCEPGETRRTPGPAGLRAFVLGPPRNEELLFRDQPRSGEKRETYLARLGAEAETVERSLRVPDGSGDLASSSPFSRRHRYLTEAKLAAMPEPAAGATHGEAALFDLYARYAAEPTRRIDAEWTGRAALLGIKLDSDTNNSSLVLAFELEPGGDVLLFAADAQVGNWLSWKEQDYGDPGAQVPIADLLERTIFYKVGHHASHNATLRDEGLELMNSPRLAAAIPVVEVVAQAKRWKMPFAPLLTRLVEKTEGRLLRGDAAIGEGLGGSAIRPAADFLKRATPHIVKDANGVETEIAVDYRVR